MIRSTFRAITVKPLTKWLRAATTLVAALALSVTAMPAQALVPVPSAPMNPVVSGSGTAGGETSMTVTWQAPLRLAGTATYQIQYTGDRGATWLNAPDVAAPTTSASITGLTAGASYQVRLRAVDGTGLLFSTWVLAAPKLDRFVQVSAGGDTTCGVLRSGEVMCWGSNGSGQIGDGTTVDRPSPVYVSGLTNVTSVAVGGAHACAVLADGTLWCWGANGAGQLGDGTRINSSVPAVVSSISGVSQVAVGLAHTCALDTTGAVFCWGSNNQGQLGTGDLIDVLNPNLAISGLTGVSSIALGDAYSCAVRTAGTVACWGANGGGQLGDGTTTRRLVPTNVSGAITTFTQVDAGDSTTCGRTSANTVYCWGNNSVGQVGDGTVLNRTAPTLVTGVTTATQVSVGPGFACARLSTSAVRCWGYNVAGQLGDGTTTNRSTSVAVTGLTTATAVTAGGVHTCALLSDNSVSCWGANNAGQLGNGSRDSFFAGRVPVSASGIVDLATGHNGYSHTCALMTDGTVTCWGSNASGESGNGTVLSPAAPAEVSGLTNVVSIAAGGDHTCAVRSNGTVWCWGSNAFGQLGNGTLDNSAVPVQATIGTNNAAAVYAYSDNTCIVRTNGGAACWGVNTAGQIGIDPLVAGDVTLTDPISGAITEVYTSAVDITGYNGDGTGLLGREPGLPGVQELAVGLAHVCALLDDTTVWCWGAGGAGELGNGCDPKALGPIDPVTGLPGDVICDSPFPSEAAGASGQSITAGDGHTCVANRDSGYIYCWGDNKNGEIGNNDPTVGNGRLPVLIPTPVFGIGSGPVDPNVPLGAQLTPAVDVVASGTHTCAIMLDSTMQCWGSNGAGELKLDYLAFGRQIAPVVTPGVSNVALATAGTSHTCVLTTDGTLQCWGYEGPDLAADPNGFIPLKQTLGLGAFGNATLNARQIALGAVPSIPTGVEGLPSNGQVLVSWAPSNANGAIVTRYNVTANPGGATCVAVGSTQCYVNALTNGTPYTFTVTATNLHGTSAASAPSAPIAPAGVPSAPTNVVGVYGDQQVTVAWTAANGGGLTVDAYDVVVYIQGVPQPSLGCSTTGALSCIVTGLTNGQAYTFGVIATNVIGQSQESFPSGFVTPSGKPFAVTNVGVSRTSTTATITWTPGGSNGLAIRSYTATASNGAECINIVGIDAPNTCTITGLTAGAAYTFSVKANNLNGDSPLTAVGAPSAVSAVRGDHEVTVSWTAAAGGDSAAVSYVVTSTPESKTCTTLSTDVSATSCKITGLTNGTQYSFAVVAFDGAGHRIAASPVTATPAGLPFRATGVGVTRSGTSATISWTASNENGATVTGYTVTASPSGKTCTTTDLTSCTITGLDLLTAYSFTVVATNAVGDSLGKVLAAPSNFVVTRGDHEVTISWTAPAGGESAAVGYTVTADSEGKGCTTASTDVAPTSCTITGLTNGKAYTFTLVATDGLGQTAEAPAVTVTPAGLPFVLAKPTAVFGKASATVSWSAGDGNGDAITKYTVTSTPGGFTCETSGTSCVVTGLTNGTEYTFAVTATNTVGTNAASVSSDAVTPGAVPEAPALTSVVAGDHKVTLVWGNAEPNGRALTGYKVTSNDPNFHCETAANVNTCVIAGLTNGSKYTFTVLATNSLGDGAGAVSAETVPYGKATAVTSAKVNGVVKGKFLVIGVKGAKSNGSAITSYKVKYAYGTSKTFSAWKTIKANGIFNVVGWPKGSTIKFQVASVNAAGQTFSKIFTLKTPTK